MRDKIKILYLGLASLMMVYAWGVWTPDESYCIADKDNYVTTNGTIITLEECLESQKPIIPIIMTAVILPSTVIVLLSKPKTHGIDNGDGS